MRCSTGPGEARPEASITMRSNGFASTAWRRRSSSCRRVSARSPCTVQHRQPLLSSTTLSSTPTISCPSMPTSPNSLTITTMRWSCCSERMRFARVVLPLPKNPTSRVTGTGSAVPCWDVSCDMVTPLHHERQFYLGAPVRSPCAFIRDYPCSCHRRAASTCLSVMWRLVRRMRRSPLGGGEPRLHLVGRGVERYRRAVTAGPSDSMSAR